MNVIDAVRKRAALLDRQGNRFSIFKYAAALPNGTLAGPVQNGAMPDQADDNQYAIPFIISTDEVDADGDVVVSPGCRLERYALNPVVFFGHQGAGWEVPIGTSRSPDGRLCVYPGEHEVKAVCWFDPHDQDAMLIHSKCMAGILSGASVAFIPVTFSKREKAHHEGGGPNGYIWEVWSQSEWSVVGVPSNAGAVRDMMTQERAYMTPGLHKALGMYAAQPRGKCFSGWCPCQQDKQASLRSPSEAQATWGQVMAKWNRIERLYRKFANQAQMEQGGEFDQTQRPGERTGQPSPPSARPDGEAEDYPVEKGDCPECGGSGECPGCDGQGRIGVHACAYCKGEGNCQGCDGTGVEKGMEADDSTGGIETGERNRVDTGDIPDEEKGGEDELDPDAQEIENRYASRKQVTDFGNHVAGKTGRRPSSRDLTRALAHAKGQTDWAAVLRRWDKLERRANQILRRRR